MVMIQPRQRVTIKGQIFGARRDSCSCDPCDCNPCKCGDGLLPNYPQWRVSGYAIQSGTFAGQSLARLVLLGLAQPAREGSLEDWHEVILVGQEATPEQIAALLALFEAELECMPAEVESRPVAQRAVYRAALRYQVTERGPELYADFSPEQANIVRAGSNQPALRPWMYAGRMNLRGLLRLATR